MGWIEHKKSEVKMLSEYSDVFAQDDLDIGNFTELEHAIDTGTAIPVKQRIRRTPACFVAEEEAHPQKMLDAGDSAKSYWINKQMFFSSQVLRNTPKKEGTRTRLVIPGKFRETDIELCQELPSAGHQGTERALSKVKDTFHWYMPRDMRTFVLTCEVCSKQEIN